MVPDLKGSNALPMGEDQVMHSEAEVQQFLADKGFDPGPVDGVFGAQSLAAYNRFCATIGLGSVASPTLAQVNDTIWPPPPKPPAFDFSTIIAIFNLTQGKTMTADQITGLIRLGLGLIGGYFVGKGIVTQSAFDWISAGILTAIPGIWSWISNRPKTIVPIAAK